MKTATLNIQDEKQIDLVSMGRVAIDLYANEIHQQLKQVKSFNKYLGGCAGNIAVGSARLGLKTAMFSAVGRDDLGTFLVETLQTEGVDTQMVWQLEHHLTGLVLLGVCPPDHFPLIFYRNDCADMQLRKSYCQHPNLANSKALLITGTGISSPSMLQVTKEAIKQAHAHQAKVIIDLDYRPVLWGKTHKGNGESRYCRDQHVSRVYQSVLSECDLIIGTEEEIFIASGIENITSGIDQIHRLSSAPIVVKTGACGSEVHFHDKQSPLRVEGFPVPVLNVLGAGDAFLSGLLSQLLIAKPWPTALRYANACGALMVTRHGCAPAMAYPEEVSFFIDNYGQLPVEDILKQVNQFAV